MIAISASIALSFTLIESTPVQAAIITYDFTTDIVPGLLSAFALEFGLPYDRQPASGFFSYDDSLLLGRGLEVVEQGNGLSAFLRYGLSVNESSLVNPFETSFRPPASIVFRDGELLGLNAIFYLPASRPGIPNFEAFEFNEQQVRNIYRYQRPFALTVRPVYSGDVFGNVQYSLRTGDTTSIPEPNAILGSCIFGLGGLIKVLKRKAVSE
jgi:hypothetical protein